MSLRNIRIAAKIAAQVINSIAPHIKAGIREKKVACFIREKIKEFGGEKESFKIIVASGRRSAIPHGYATLKKIKNGDAVIVDFGVLYRGWRSDITRTFFVGTLTNRQRKIYNLVKKAQKKAISCLKAGVNVREIDLVVRKEFRKQGLEKYFVHSTGHGIGRKVHKAPKISSKVETPIRSGSLQEGMVVTIEPGLYFKGWGGVRIEDMVLVKKKGYEILTR